MLDRYARTDKPAAAAPPKSDLWLSVVLPASVIALGLAASIGVAGGVDALLALCSSALR